MSNNLPPNWSLVKLGDVCEILDNKRSPINSNERDKRISGKPIESLFPYYGATGQVGYIDDYLLEGEFVLLGEDGAPFLEKHKPKAYIVNGKIWVNNHAHILLSKNHNKFLCYYLNFLDYHPFVTGTTRLKLNQSSMRQIPIINPPLPEQKKIVEKIEELFSGLDSGVASLKKAKAQIRLYRQSVLASAFSGRLHQDSSDYKINRIKEKNKSGKSLNPANPQILVNHGSDNLPNGWKWVKVSDVGDIVTGTTPSKKVSEYYGNDFPLYKPTDLNAGINTRKASDNISKLGATKARLLPEKSTMVTCIGATIGKTGLNKITGTTNQQINSIIPNKNYIPECVYYFCISEFFQDQIKTNASSTTLPILNKSKFELLPFIQIPLTQQTQIVEEIEKRFSEADNLEKAIDDSLAKSETLRQSILKKAFEGQLV